MNDKYFKKYLKYKIKYLELIGGSYNTNVRENIRQTINYLVTEGTNQDYNNLFKNTLNEIETTLDDDLKDEITKRLNIEYTRNKLSKGLSKLLGKTNIDAEQWKKLQLVIDFMKKLEKQKIYLKNMKKIKN